MKYSSLSLLFGCLICVTINAHAEVRYVTDELNLSLYEQINSKGKLLKRLKSGTQLDLLSEQGLFAKVRTMDGTVGWTKAGFLINSKPARAMVIELTAENDQLKESLRLKQQQISEHETLLQNLKDQEQQANSELQGQLENTEGIVAALDRIQRENERLRAQQGHFGNMVPVKWALVAAGITFISGIIAGIALFDYRSRRRHGGFRIY
jgi:SH3 domain protein